MRRARRTAERNFFKSFSSAVLRGLRLSAPPREDAVLLLRGPAVTRLPLVGRTALALERSYRRAPLALRSPQDDRQGRFAGRRFAGQLRRTPAPDTPQTHPRA